MQKYVIALYIRLSIEDYKYDSMSIENQRLVLNEYASAMPEALNSEVLEFVDNGYSGTNFERPQVQKLIEMVRENRIDCIIVKDFSRFGRNSIETGYFLERVFRCFTPDSSPSVMITTATTTRAIRAAWMWPSSTLSVSITAGICPSKPRAPNMPRCSGASIRVRFVPMATARVQTAEWSLIPKRLLWFS